MAIHIVHEHVDDEEIRALAPSVAWVPWPVSWSAVFVGALATMCALVMFGLIGLCIGALALQPGSLLDWRNLSFVALLFTVSTVFFAFVIGGWAAGAIAGQRRSEASALHGAISWLVAVPMLLVMLSIGAGGTLGLWFSAFGKDGLRPSIAAPAQSERRLPVHSDETGASEPSRQVDGAPHIRLLEAVRVEIVVPPDHMDTTRARPRSPH